MIITAKAENKTQNLRRIGKYDILDKLGEGGMSSVYKARHPGLDRHVIIKELKQADEDQAALRFRREARIMMDLRHENIVQVHDYFIHRGRRYIVMEFVDGISLEALLEREKILPVPMALLIAREVARALKHAHDRGIIHRDVKPGNIMIARTGAVKLTDFGIATSREDAGEGLTVCGMTLGTPAYMSPEQFMSTRDVSRRADIYSLGITLYEMLCGRKPFPGSFTPETITAIRDGRYERPDRINPSLPAAVVRLIRRTMHRKEKRRYRDLNVIIRKLNRKSGPFRDILRAHEYIRGVVWENRTAPKPSGNRARRRKRILAAASSVALLTGLALYGVSSGLSDEIFRSATHGALRVVVRFRDAGDFPEDPRIRGALVPETGNRPAFPLRFTRKSGDPELRTDKLYLPAGRYRLRLRFENQLYIRELNLRPRAHQRKQASTAGLRSVTIRTAPARRVPIHVFYRTRDASNDRDITGITRFSVYYFGWQKWNDFIKRPDRDRLLVSGKRFLFRFEAPGYRSTAKGYTVARGENRLQIDIALEPDSDESRKRQ